MGPHTRCKAFPAINQAKVILCSYPPAIALSFRLCYRAAIAGPDRLKPVNRWTDRATMSDEGNSGYGFHPHPSADADLHSGSRYGPRSTPRSGPRPLLRVGPRPLLRAGPPSHLRSGPPSHPQSGPPSHPQSELPSHLQWGPMTSLLPQQTRRTAGITPGQRSGTPRWLLVLIVFVLFFVAPGALAAIGIPAFLHQKARAEHEATTVVLPARFDGQQRNTGAKARSVAKRYAMGDIRAEDIAVYGKIGPGTVILLALKPATAWSGDQLADRRSEIEQGFAARGTPLFLIREPDPAELGGWIGCGATGTGLQVCLAISTGHLVMVISKADDDDPVSLLGQAQAAAVHHS